MNINNLKIGSKLLTSFLIVSTVLVIVGWMGFQSIKSIESATDEIIETAPLVDAAMEMKYAVGRDMQMIMEILAAGDQGELDDVWKEHENFVAVFDAMGEAIKNGGTVDGSVFHAAKDKN